MDYKWITPSKEQASGSGTRNKFTHRDYIVIESLKAMLAMGIPRKYAGELAKTLQKSKKHMDVLLYGKDLTDKFFKIYVDADGNATEQQFPSIRPGEYEVISVGTRVSGKTAIVYEISLDVLYDKIKTILTE